MKLHLLICFLLHFAAFSQNLVPNGDFECITRCPHDLGHFYVCDWKSASYNASPDLYSTCSKPGEASNPDWEYCKVKPFSGQSFAGIILADKKTVYRENITVQLYERLIEGEVYNFSVRLAIPSMPSCRIKYLDVLLTTERQTSYDGYSHIIEEPQIEILLDSLDLNGSWKEFSFEYIAHGNEAFLTIGCFRDEKEINIQKIPKRDSRAYSTIYNDAYTLIDDVNLSFKTDEEEFQIQNNKPSEPVVAGKKPIVLRNLNFAHGSSSLEPGNVPELDELIIFLDENPEMSISITGHTDNTGSVERNQQLSLERAITVSEYLKNSGVEEYRMRVFGKGSELPVADNTTEEGRNENRRVVIQFEVEK